MSDVEEPVHLFAVRYTMPTPQQRKNGFKSAAHRAAVFATDPQLGQNIARKYGAKVGGGFTKAQLDRRRSAAGKGQTYRGAS